MVSLVSNQSRRNTQSDQVFRKILAEVRNPTTCFRICQSDPSLLVQVDDGDIAFVIRAMFSPYELVAEKKKYNRQGILYAIDPVVNLATVNYILHGLQRYGFDKNDHKWWHTMWIALGIDEHFSGLKQLYDNRTFSAEMFATQKLLVEISGSNDKVRTPAVALKRLYLTLKLRVMRRKLVDYLMKNVIKPFGIPRGSEKQGERTMDHFWITVTCAGSYLE